MIDLAAPSAMAPAVPPAEKGGWAAFEEELNRWRRAGREATFWLRDDDAGALHPGLERLLGLAARFNVPVGLAVVPAWLRPELAQAVRGRSDVAVLQHGWAHTNHAPVGAKKAELGDHRPASAVIAELQRGQAVLAERFGEQNLPVLVPPWNRIGRAVASALDGAGYRGLSLFADARPALAPAMVQRNPAVDPVAWRGDRGFIGEAAALAALTGALERRRLQVWRQAPTGLLSHHAVHTEPVWTFFERAMALIDDHPAARALHPTAAFGFAR